jgi:hypothetical protein
MKMSKQPKDPSFHAFTEAAADAFEIAFSGADAGVADIPGLGVLARLVDLAFGDDQHPAPAPYEGSPSS